MTELADEPSSLLDWVAGLAVDPAGRARLTEDPRAVLTQQGLADLSPVDVHHALPLVTDVVASRLGVDVDAREVPDLRPGEDPVSALGRQFVGVTERVLGVEVSADEAPDPYDDLDARDLPDDTGPHDHDLDDLDVPDPEFEPDAEPPTEIATETTATAEAAEAAEATEADELADLVPDLPPEHHDHEPVPPDHGPDPVDQFDDLL